MSDPIDVMPAGPEMDRLVAEKVMGWTSDQVAKYFGDYGFRPSRDIAHAWEMMERLKALEPCLSWSDEQHCWFFSFEKRPVSEQCYGDAAPLAVCRSALMAVR